MKKLLWALVLLGLVQQSLLGQPVEQGTDNPSASRPDKEQTMVRVGCFEVSIGAFVQRPAVVVAHQRRLSDQGGNGQGGGQSPRVSH